MKCPQPVKRLLMMRGPNLVGPFVQNWGKGVCVRSQGNAYGPGGPLAGARLEFEAIVPGAGGEMQGVARGHGDLQEARTATLLVPDHQGYYREYQANEPAYEGARVDLDPAKLVADLTVTGGTPNPLTSLKIAFLDSSTFRCKYGDASDYYFSESIASNTVAPHNPGTGKKIALYAGDLAQVKEIDFNTSSLSGDIPDISSFPNIELAAFNGNGLINQIRGLTNKAKLVRYYCQFNQITGFIPNLSTLSALGFFYCYNNSITQFEGGWPNRAVNFNASVNALVEDAVNRILIDADTYGVAPGTIINLTGGTNAAPTGAGITAKNNLIANGATVTTN